MGTHPSKTFNDGVLTERAIDTNEPGEPNEAEAAATKPYKAPEPAQVRLGAKRIAEAENKAVKATKKGTKAAKK